MVQQQVVRRRGVHPNANKSKYPVEEFVVHWLPCNAIHYLESKYGPLPIATVWNPVARPNGHGTSSEQASVRRVE